MNSLVTNSRCPRCSGNLIRGWSDISCLNCGREKPPAQLLGTDDYVRGVGLKGPRLNTVGKDGKDNYDGRKAGR